MIPYTSFSYLYEGTQSRTFIENGRNSPATTTPKLFFIHLSLSLSDCYQSDERTDGQRWQGRADQKQLEEGMHRAKGRREERKREREREEACDSLSIPLQLSWLCSLFLFGLARLPHSPLSLVLVTPPPLCSSHLIRLHSYQLSADCFAFFPLFPTR